MKRALCTLAAVSFLVSPAAGQVSPPSGAVSDTQAVLINSPGFVISQPGSYRVARNLSSASTVSNLITVNASNVTIDLGGHLLSGGGRGVDIGGAVSNVVVRNGTFTGQADNAIEGPSTGAGNLLIEDVVARDLNGGLFCFSTPNMIIRDVIVSNTAGAGIAVGDGSILERVTMSDIGGNGMNVQEFVQVRNVTMRNIGGIGIRSDGRLHAESVLIESTGSEGIVGASTAFIRDCHVRNAGRFAPPTRSVAAPSTDPLADGSGWPEPVDDVVPGPFVSEEGLVYYEAGDATRSATDGEDGIRVGIDSLVIDCSVVLSTEDGIALGTGSKATGCSSSDNSGAGFIALNNAKFEDCQAYSNTGAGFSIGSDGDVRSCNASSNTGAGYLFSLDGLVADSTANNNSGGGVIVGDDGTVERCKIENNSTFGIDVNGTGCRIDSNHLAINLGNGIQLDSSSNLVVRNFLENDNIFNTPGQNNVIGQIITTNPATLTSSTGAWANFQF